MRRLSHIFFFFFFNDTATTEIYTLSLHDALPICSSRRCPSLASYRCSSKVLPSMKSMTIYQHLASVNRSEEHTSELQSRPHLVCRLLLEKKKKPKAPISPPTCVQSRAVMPVMHAD